MKYKLRTYYNNETGWVGTYYDDRHKCMITLQSCLSNKYAVHWRSNNNIPKNWNGYSEKNPSPGRDIRYHEWEIDCNEEELLAVVLKTNAAIEKS